MATYVAPSFGAEAFHCPHCDTYAHQWWSENVGCSGGYRSVKISGLQVSECARCGKKALWLNEKMIEPAKTMAPMAASDMPPDVREDYDEARLIVGSSPRGACALLRLAAHKLMSDLDAEGDNPNAQIGDLVKKGLPVKIQKALDALRVVGNHAVHPGVLDLKDDMPTAISLFGALNMIVDVLITQPQAVDALYGKLPPTSLEQIERRDGVASDAL